MNGWSFVCVHYALSALHCGQVEYSLLLMLTTYSKIKKTIEASQHLEV